MGPAAHRKHDRKTTTSTNHEKQVQEKLVKVSILITTKDRYRSKYYVILLGVVELWSLNPKTLPLNRKTPRPGSPKVSPKSSRWA